MRKGKKNTNDINSIPKTKAIKEGNKLSFKEQLEIEEAMSEFPSNSKQSKLSTVDDHLSRLDEVKVNLSQSKGKGRSMTRSRKNSDVDNNLNMALLSSHLSVLNKRSLSQTSKGARNLRIESQFEKFESFPYDNSILKQIDIEFEVKMPEGLDQEEIKQFQEELDYEFKYFFLTNPFVYFEYSNPRQQTNYIHSFIDNINYDFLYEKSNENLYSANKNTASVIRDINYISAMSSIFKKLSRVNVLNTDYEFFNDNIYLDFFYMVTPLVSFYFFKYEQTDFFKQSVSDVNDSGVLISNYNRAMERSLKEYGVVYKILKTKDGNGINNMESKRKSKKKNNNSIPLYSLPNNSSEVELLSSFINSYDEDQNSNFDSVIFIKNYYATLFFNMLINQYETSSMNIFAPFSFETSTYHQCKSQIASHVRNDRTLVVNVKIYGCIFHIYLQKLIKFLTEATFLRHEEDNEEMPVDKDLDANEKKKSKSNRRRKKPKPSEEENKNCQHYPHTYSMRFVHFLKTSNFFSANKKLSGPVEKMQYKDNAFYIKVQSN